MRKQNRIGLIVTTAMLGFVAASSATAAPVQYCKNYAGLAILQSTQMKDQNRGCTGFRWHNWYDGHYKWCRDVSKDAALAEFLVRQHTISNNGPC